MPLRFSLRTLFLAVFLVSILLWLFAPIASINSRACARIRPGMTVEQVQDILGVPPGRYDGVQNISTSAPWYKGYHPEKWVGIRGELLVDLDEAHRVAQANFYPGRVTDWSPGGYVWERFTRIRYSRFSLPGRIALFLTSLAGTVFLVGAQFVPPRAKNQAATSGLIGLVAGAVLSVAIYSDGFSANELMMTLTMTGSIVGAVVGVLVGFARLLNSGPITEELLDAEATGCCAPAESPLSIPITECERVSLFVHTKPECE